MVFLIFLKRTMEFVDEIGLLPPKFGVHAGSALRPRPLSPRGIRTIRGSTV